MDLEKDGNGTSKTLARAEKVSKRLNVSRAVVLIPPFPWDKTVVSQSEVPDKQGEVVVVLHGLWRSRRAMQPLADHLHEAGYTTINVPYPSFRMELENLAQIVQAELRPYLDSGKKVHIVTHSLGGVVAKKLIELLEQEDLEKLGRVVMLAPPHRGSEIIDWLRISPLRPLSGILGPARNFLSTASMAREKCVLRSGVEAAVIMGERCAMPLFKTLLDSSNDGIISVEKGKLEGIQHFKVVDADHTFIASNEKVMDIVLQFIETGSL